MQKILIFGIIYNIKVSEQGMNIFKTFEIFLREPLSILKEKFIQIVNVNSPHASISSVNIDNSGKNTQITVVNNDKMFNLLQTVLYKQEKKAAQKLILPPSRGQVVLGQLCKRI